MMLNYEDILKEISNGESYLLMGNGFSMSYNKERFSFTSLFESAVEKNIITKNSSIYKLFKTFQTNDFEEIIKTLESTTEVIKQYQFIDSQKVKVIQEDSEKLKKYLVEIITNNHPEKITEIKDEEFASCIKFITPFKKIYTLNYDLLLYWTIMKINSNRDIYKKLDFTDGFHSESETDDYVVYANDSKVKQNIFYLHGGLHIFDNNDSIIKNTYSRTNKNLVIFGTLLKKNDNHIKEAIVKNKVNKIYIGVGSVEDINSLNGFVEELKKCKPSKIIKFYDYTTVNVWRS